MTDEEPLLSGTSDDQNGVLDHAGFSTSREEQKKRHVTKNLAVAIGACVLGSSFQFGYNTGVVNAPEKIIEAFINESHYKTYHTYILESSSLMTTLWAIIVSIFCVGGMIGGVAAGYLANKFGRKRTLLMNNAITIVAAGLMGFSKLTNSYEMLIAGRFVIGISAGINTAVAPLYLSEIAPTALRGFAGTFNQLAITAGVLASNIVGQTWALGTESSWPYVFGATIVPVVFQLIILPYCPETPRFLILNRQLDDDAERALIWLRQTEDVGEELEEMRHERNTALHSRKFTIGDLIWDPDLRHALIISIVMQLSQQLSGINAITYYSTKIFLGAGLTLDVAQYATMAIGAVNVLMTFVSALIMDRAGRRTLHLIGLGGLFIFTTILTIALLLQHKVPWLSYVCIGAVTLYIIFFATGPGSIPWFFVAEIFAQGPRPAAMSVSVFVNWLANFSVGLGFPEMEAVIGPYTFLIFAVLLALFWVFTLLRVPETKGRTIEEIQMIFKQRTAPKVYRDVEIEGPPDHTVQTGLI